MGFFDSISSALGGIGGYFLKDERDKDFASDEAGNQRHWQNMFYQHRHQWEIEDLKKSGLNPVLTAGLGAAGVPSGGVAHSPSGMDPITSALSLQQKKESESRVNLNEKQEQLLAEQTKSASAVALKEGIDAALTKSKYDQTTGTPLGEKVVPLLKDSPKWLKFPLEFFFGTATDMKENREKINKGEGPIIRRQAKKEVERTVKGKRLTVDEIRKIAEEVDREFKQKKGR